LLVSVLTEGPTFIASVARQFPVILVEPLMGRQTVQFPVNATGFRARAERGADGLGAGVPR
jgi:hypothetical protein